MAAVVLPFALSAVKMDHKLTLVYVFGLFYQLFGKNTSF